MMGDVGGNGLRRVRLDDHIGDRLRPSNEAQRSGLDAQTTPGPLSHSVGAAERVRHRALVPRRRGSHHAQAVGELATVAERTAQRRANSLISFGGVVDPRGQLERRTMTHMLAVMAIEQRNPVPDVVDNEADDLALHSTKRTSAVPTTRGPKAAVSGIAGHATGGALPGRLAEEFPGRRHNRSTRPSDLCADVGAARPGS